MNQSAAIKLARLHRAAYRYLLWALLAWLGTLVFLCMRDGGGTVKDLHAPVYQMVTAAGALALLVFGLFNVYFGLVNGFSVWEVLRTVLALCVGGLAAAFLGIERIDREMGRALNE